MAVQLQAKGGVKKRETMHQKGCVLQLCSALAGLRVVICLDVSVLFLSSDKMLLISAIPCWKMGNFFCSYVVYYNTGKSCEGFKNNVWPSLCQDFIVFCTDF